MVCVYLGDENFSAKFEAQSFRKCRKYAEMLGLTPVENNLSVFRRGEEVAEMNGKRNRDR